MSPYEDEPREKRMQGKVRRTRKVMQASADRTLRDRVEARVEAQRKVVQALLALPEADRIDVFAEFCRGCGSFTRSCQCQNDE